MQSGQHISVLGQFHLCLGIGGLGPHGKDVENEARAVKDFHLQLLLDVAHLLCRKLIIEYHHTHRTRLRGQFLSALAALVGYVFLSLYVLPYLLELALAHVCHAARATHALRKPPHGDCSGCIGQELQLVKILLCLRLVLLLGDKAHEHGCLGLDFGYYKFFHYCLLNILFSCKDMK